MMKKILGKIVFIVTIIIFPIIGNAKVVLQAPDTFYKNDIVHFKIVATGTDINLPEIKNIGGEVVQRTGTSQHTTIINGARSYQFSQSYTLKGKSDIHIPSFEIMIDNKIEKTKAKTIKMLKVEKTKSDLYDLKISIDKKTVYVGEPIVFTLKFKYKKDLEIVSLDFNKPDFESFWVKELNPQKSQNNYTQYVEQEVKYLLFPQKAGSIQVEPLKIGVTTIKNNSYGKTFYLSSPTVTTPVYSNGLEIDVKPLPKGINLIGNFTIKSTIDKSSIDQGDAISYKLYIEGRGNIDDLDEVVVDIPNTIIYDNPSKKEYNIKDNLYGGKYTKTYSLIGKESFTIPSIELKYFDNKTNSVKIIKTKEYRIKVNTKEVKKSKLEIAAPTKPLSSNLEQKVTVVKISNKNNIIFFTLGFLSAILLASIYFFWRKKETKKSEIPLLKKVRTTKTPNELFKILLVYINIDKELDKIIYKLEKLSQEDYKKEKRNILKVLKELIEKDIKLDQ